MEENLAGGVSPVPPTGLGGSGRESEASAPEIFLSYSRADEDLVLELYDELREQGLRVWIDQRDIAAGAPWDESIAAALDASTAFVLMASQSSVESNNVADEVVLAKSRDKLLLFVLLEEITDWKKLSLHAARPQHILAWGEHRALFVDELVAAVRAAPQPVEGLLQAPTGAERARTKRRRKRRRRDLLIGTAVAVAFAGVLAIARPWQVAEAAGDEPVALLVRLEATPRAGDAATGRVDLIRLDDGTSLGTGEMKIGRPAVLFWHTEPLPHLASLEAGWAREVGEADESWKEFFLGAWANPIAVGLEEPLRAGVALRVEFRAGIDTPRLLREATLTLTPGVNDCVLADEGR